MSYHQPVLLEESIEGLNIKEEGVYADLTFGGGGHSREILKRLGEAGRLIGFDQDADARSNQLIDDRFGLVQANFRFLSRFLEFLEIEKLDGIIADLGLSSHQIDVPEKGFSHRWSGPLDMRMNEGIERTAQDVLMESDEGELLDIFSKYGEIRNSRMLARRVVAQRKVAGLKTTADLVTMVEPLIRGNRRRYLSQVFQALRIAVNEELKALEEMLEAATYHLRPGGRLVVISYHSLEDRIVKNFIRTGNVEGLLKKDEFGVLLTPFKKIYNKPIVPSDRELKINPRSRSAKLRIAERI
ncbi:MAG: 16S rRNA (cytosine(1402)-N(4))-methyltransferase RsmH [Saprospirales bacterium]|nr:MAG: 16S rRNA (cytosine(1402)-N(4))-methyltransferase RsmH [Saprospirales bacterium]